MIWNSLIIISEVFSLYMVITSEILQSQLRWIFGTLIVFAIIVTTIVSILQRR